MNRILFSIALLLGVLNLPAQENYPNAIPLMVGEPYLQNISSEGVTIMYQTTEPCHQWVEFGTDSTKMEMRRALLGGQEICHDRLGKVRLEGLQAGTKYYYRVCCRKFLKNKTYSKEFGEQQNTRCYSFQLPREDEKNLRVLILNDLHLNGSSSLPEALKVTKGWKYDMVVMNGDCLTEPQSLDDAILRVHTLTSAFNGAEIPILFVRGNHEIRGAYSSGLPLLLDNPGGKTYGAFSWGETRFMVLDCGEDKPDDHREYFGLNDFTSFREEQVPFIKQELKSKEFRKAKTRIMLSHVPLWGDGDSYHPCTDLWAPLLKKAPIDVSITGHFHRLFMYEKGEKDGNPFPLLIASKPMSTLLVKEGPELRLEIWDGEGCHIRTWWLKGPKAKEKTTVKNVVVYGNSITKHGIAKDLWWGEWGMAATEREKDFCHLLQKRLGKDAKVDAVNVGGWERDLNSSLDEYFGKYITPETEAVVVRLGENVTKPELLEEKADEMLTYLKSKTKAKIIMTGNFWKNGVKEKALHHAAAKHGIPFLRLDDLDRDSYKEKMGGKVAGDDGQIHEIIHEGVAAHPNDKAMEEIARRIYQLF